MNDTDNMRSRESRQPQGSALRVLACAEAEPGLRAIADVLETVAHAHVETVAARGNEGSVAGSVARILAASRCDVAVLRCDAALGVTDAVLQQAYLLKLCGVRHILAAVVEDGRDADARRFDAIANTFRSFAARAEIDDAEALPVSQLAARVSRIADDGAVADAALRLRVDAATPLAQRQWRCRATIEGGVPRAGQAVTVFPSQRPGRIIELEEHVRPSARAGQPAAFAIETEVRPRAGDVLAADPLPEISDQIAAHLAWTASEPLYPGRTYLLRIAGDTVGATVTALKHRVEPRNLEPRAARFLVSGEIGFCNLSLGRPVVFDRDPRRCSATRVFHLLDRASDHELAVGFPAYGLRRATNLTRQDIAVGGAARAAIKGQRPCVLWFTGLSGAGKSSAASAVDQQLHALGRHTYLLDGDNVRHGLCRDLGFTPADRVENIRRVAEVARLMVDAGLIVLVSFISPFRDERRMARELFEAGQFVEIFMDTPLSVCEARDTKGLYRKARRGELVNFTGIDSPYEFPENPDIRLRPEDGPADAQAATVIDFLQKQGRI